MKRGRVDEIQFHTTATARAGGTTTATHRIITPPQHNNNTPNANQNQYQFLNVLKDPAGNNMVAPPQNIQYTYTPQSVPNAAAIQKSNAQQQPPPSVHVVNTSVNLTNSVRPKPTASGAITPTSHNVTSPGGTTVTATGTSSTNAQNVSGQNFPRLKVEDALSYLDQVGFVLTRSYI